MDWNKCIFIGRVKATPQISENKGVKQAYFKFTLKDRAPDGNGQWVDKFMDVDIFARDKKAELFEKYVVAGQELTLECKYVNWEANGSKGHAFQVLNVAFGFKPKNTEPTATAPTAPPI